MAKVSPWYSIKSYVHHVCTNCTEGNNIEPENRRSGTGEHPLCKTCSDLISDSNC